MKLSDEKWVNVYNITYVHKIDNLYKIFTTGGDVVQIGGLTSAVPLLLECLDKLNVEGNMYLPKKDKA